MNFIIFLLLSLAPFFISASEASLTCTKLFPSQNEAVFQLTGFVFGPSNQGHKLQDSVVNTTWNQKNSWSKQQQHNEYDPEYVGFVAHPDYVNFVARVNSYYRGLQLFIEGFSKRAPPEEIQNIITSDHKNFWNFINSGRLGFALVRAGQKFAGFMRIMDCTDYSRVRSKGQIPSPSQDYLSPTEVAAIRNGQKIDFYENMRNLGYHIFQIGKYVINSRQTAADRDSTRKFLLSWLKKNYLQASEFGTEKVVFVFNVDSQAHKDLYMKEFDATEVPRNQFDPPWPENESLLYVDLKTLLEKLKDVDQGT